MKKARWNFFPVFCPSALQSRLKSLEDHLNTPAEGDLLNADLLSVLQGSSFGYRLLWWCFCVFSMQVKNSAALQSKIKFIKKQAKCLDCKSVLAVHMFLLVKKYNKVFYKSKSCEWKCLAIFFHPLKQPKSFHRRPARCFSLAHSVTDSRPSLLLIVITSLTFNLLILSIYFLFVHVEYSAFILNDSDS